MINRSGDYCEHGNRKDRERPAGLRLAQRNHRCGNSAITRENPSAAGGTKKEHEVRHRSWQITDLSFRRAKLSC